MTVVESKNRQDIVVIGEGLPHPSSSLELPLLTLIFCLKPQAVVSLVAQQHTI